MKIVNYRMYSVELLFQFKMSQSQKIRTDIIDKNNLYLNTFNDVGRTS